MTMNAAITAELMRGFLVESREIAQKLAMNLLELERTQSDPAAASAQLEDLARGLHTLKGSAATLGLSDLSELAHRMEDAVAPVRRSGQKVASALADALLKSLDTFVTDLEARIENPALGSGAIHAATDALRALIESGHANGESPPSEAVTAVSAPAADAVPAASDRRPAADADEWRVSTRNVTSMMRTVERLRELRGRLDERRALARRLGASLAAEAGSELERAAAELARLLALDAGEVTDAVATLEEELKQISTQPLRSVLGPLQRTVRDLCRSLGKEARLSTVGAELALDRRVLAALKGPLIHLVRNALDHGFETPAERERVGKHREGALVIRADQVGNLLTIEVSDDGRGIDPAQVAAAAVRRGLLSEAEAAALDETATLRLLFRSGFSTRTDVTETSGRGVGLDVVEKDVRSMDGTVDIQSRAGQGTRFVLQLPLELGASAVLLVRSGELQLGLPIGGIESVLPLAAAQVRVSRRKLELLHGEQVLPLLDLAAELRLRPLSKPAAGQPVAIVQVDGMRVAVAVDEILGDRELVVRPLPAELRHVDAFQGVASLVGVEQLLVVRLGWLVRRDSQEVQRGRTERQVLVIDDSLTARSMHRSILESGGYLVHAVGSARQGLEQLRQASYDLLVCDVSMEELDGLALTAIVRADPRTRSLPVILVSAQEGEEVQRRCAAAGADAFLTKRECAYGRLLDEAARVLKARSDVR